MPDYAPSRRRSAANERVTATNQREITTKRVAAKRWRSTKRLPQSEPAADGTSGAGRSGALYMGITMTHLRSLACIVLLLAIGGPCSASSAGGVFDRELAPLAEDVYLIRRPDPLRQPVEGNSVIIVNESDVVVIDSGGAPLSAANALRLIRSITSKPVSVLINTHWHGDHNMGNQVYREAFPALRIVSHEATQGHMAGETMSYVAGLPAELDGYIKEFEAMAAKEPLSERRRLMLEDLRVAKREVEQVRVTPPDLTFTDKLTLHHGKREIQVLHLGKGNTDGDAVVWLPQQKILISGDLVVHPLPYGIGSYPREWLATLAKLGELPFELLVPGHGEPQKDRAYIQQLSRTLASIREQVGAAVAKGLDLEATTKAIDTSAFEAQYTGGDPLRKMLFTAWWVNPIVRSAWLEARGEPIVQSGKSDNR
jgi:glyoxylase-like metal-dependent hydrolase (beta-lactamase superfamily II)